MTSVPELMSRSVPWDNVNRAAGDRADYRRNRQITFSRNAVTTDGQGNILARPLTRRLPCFGDIVEHVFGLHDNQRQWGDKEPQASGCAGCQVAAYCAKVVQERLWSSSELLRLRDEWSAATALLAPAERYSHPTWTAFVDECGAHAWHDSNYEALNADDERRAAEKRMKDSRRARDKRSRNKARPKAVSPALAARIDAYRDDRMLDMAVAGLDEANAPLWLRFRTAERRELLANAWWAREILLETGAKASGRQVADMLVEIGRAPTPMPNHFIKVVEEALRRVQRLLESGEWPEFECEPSTSPRRVNAGMSPAVVTELLD